jgi:hypothetical protein
MYMPSLQVVFQPPSIPVLLQILSGAKTAQELIPNNTITLPPNKVVELSIPGGVIGGGVSMIPDFSHIVFLVLISLIHRSIHSIFTVYATLIKTKKGLLADLLIAL